MMAVAPRRIGDVVARAELTPFLTVSNARGVGALLRTWGLIVGAFAAASAWPHPAVALVAIVALGTQQHALAILLHEATHGVLFSDRRWNDRIGRWLCAAPVLVDFEAYRRSHLDHHVYTGTERDPDRALLRDPFPRTRGSLARKLARDAVGITGVRRVVGITAMGLGFLEFNLNGAVRRVDQRGRTWRDVLRDAHARLGPMLVAQGALALALALAGHAALYGLWALGYGTVFSVVLRVRSIGDHACTPEPTNPFRGSRTIHLAPWERALIAPFDVTFHIEHHLAMTVPWYHLRGLHALLAERGAIDPACVARGYGEVLALASSAPRAPTSTLP